MTIIYHKNLMQRTDEWLAARCGLLTASEMKFVLTEKTLKTASNDKSRAHVWELLGQRVNNYVEPTYQSFDMQRGVEDEEDALILYNQHYAPVERCGFVTNDMLGFKLGYSPDGLVGDQGQIEVKSCCQKWQMEVICDFLPAGKMPPEHVIQVQTGLLITQRAWCDFISYGNGQPMVVIRVTPDLEVQEAIIAAATSVEKDIAEKMTRYNNTLAKFKCVPTLRKNRSDDLVL